MARSIVQRLLHLGYAALWWCGVFYLFNHFRKRGTILAYHNVLPDAVFDASLHLGVSHSLTEFETQIEVTSRYLNITTDFECTDPHNCVVTFDDGYRNNLDAAKVLERHGIRGVFFVPIAPLENGKTLVIDRVQMWFSYVPSGTYRLPSGDITITEENRNEAYSGMYDWLLANTANWNNVPTMLDACFSYSRLDISEEMRSLRFSPMNRGDIGRLRAAGHKIGCHSWDHRPLSRLSDSDMYADFEYCEGMRGVFDSSNVYSYPFGGEAEVDERSIKACEAFGYSGAVMNVDSHPKMETRFTRRRRSLPMGAPNYVLAAKLSGFEAFLLSFRRTWHW